MNYQELNEARRKLGLTIPQMGKLIGASPSTYKGWGTRGEVPDYIANSVEAHLLLSKNALALLLKQREI